MRDFPKLRRWRLSGWPAILLAPILLPIAIVVGRLQVKKTRDRSATEVTNYLRDFIDGTGGEWDWDEFESVAITNPLLEEIRREAAAAGPPNADLPRLRMLLQRANALRMSR